MVHWECTLVSSGTVINPLTCGVATFLNSHVKLGVTLCVLKRCIIMTL